MNKKLLIGLASLLVLPACADKNHFEEAVLEEMKKEQDVKDYNIPPEKMAKCVVDTTYQKMPGFFPFAPERLAAYRNYAKMLTLTQSPDPKKTLEQLRNDFGSPQELAKAHSVYTESIMDCYSAINQQGEEDQKVLPPPETKG